MKRQGIVLASLGALALIFGVSRSLRLSEPGEGSLRVSSVGEQTEAMNESPMIEPAAVPPRSRRPAAESNRQVTTPAPEPLWAVMDGAAPDEWRKDLGEPLDADDSEAPDLIEFGGDLISLGTPLDADGPMIDESDLPSEPPDNIGESLQPDDPGASLAALDDPINIGPDLDADDHLGWGPDRAVSAPVEIGEMLDAGMPSR